MKQNTTRIFLVLASIAALIGCAKTVSEGTNVAEKRYFDAYMSTHYPNLGKIGYGIYILDSKETSGEEIADSNYIFVRYICRTLVDSEIVSYTDPETAQKMGEYNSGYDYSPYIFRVYEGQASQGIMDMIAGGTDPVSGKTYGRLRIGETRTAIIPGWLSSTSSYYDTEKEYIDNITGTDYLYEITAVDQTPDIIEWQIDTIERFLDKKGWDIDSLPGNYGMYYYRDKLREKQRGVTVKDSHVMPEDTTVYINYIGRLLSGKVFDTNIEDTAKVWNIYDASKTYEPAAVAWSADSTALTLDDSSVITGFSLTLFQMHPFESGHGIFTSDYGYGYSGSGNTIPSYAPLLFDIDIVKNPDE